MNEVEKLAEQGINENIIVKYLTDYLNEEELDKFHNLLTTNVSFRKELSRCLAVLAIADSVIDLI